MKHAPIIARVLTAADLPAWCRPIHYRQRDHHSILYSVDGKEIVTSAIPQAVFRIRPTGIAFVNWHAHTPSGVSTAARGDLLELPAAVLRAVADEADRRANQTSRKRERSYSKTANDSAQSSR